MDLKNGRLKFSWLSDTKKTVSRYLLPFGLKKRVAFDVNPPEQNLKSKNSVERILR